MDDIDRELINLLCTKIGMLMEDHCARELVIGSQTRREQQSEINELAHASTKIAKLAAAAQSARWMPAMRPNPRRSHPRS
jgi:hypothetical protein